MDYAQALAQVLSARIDQSRTVTARGTVTAVTADGFVTFTDAIGGTRRGVWVDNPPRVGDVITYLDEGGGFPLVLGAVGRPAAMTVCTSSTRPTISLYSGMQIFETDTQLSYRYNGSVWMCFTGAWTAFHGGQALLGGAYASMVSFTLPPGNFVIHAKMEYIDSSGTNGNNNPFIQIWDNTGSVELDHTEGFDVAGIRRTTLASHATLSSTTSKSIHGRARETSAAANKSFAQLRLTAMATSVIN